jgi:hypothetical protein
VPEEIRSMTRKNWQPVVRKKITLFTHGADCEVFSISGNFLIKENDWVISFRKKVHASRGFFIKAQIPGIRITICLYNQSMRIFPATA